KESRIQHVKMRLNFSVSFLASFPEGTRKLGVLTKLPIRSHVTAHSGTTTSFPQCCAIRHSVANSPLYFVFLRHYSPPSFRRARQVNFCKSRYVATRLAAGAGWGSFNRMTRGQKFFF